MACESVPVKFCSFFHCLSVDTIPSLFFCMICSLFYCILYLWSLRSLFVQLENHLNYISMLVKCVQRSFHWVDKPQSFLFAAFLLRLVVHLLLLWIYRMEMDSLSHSDSSLLMFEPFWLLRWLFLGDCGIYTLLGDLSGEPMGLLLLLDLDCMVK